MIVEIRTDNVAKKHKLTLRPNDSLEAQRLLLKVKETLLDHACEVFSGEITALEMTVDGTDDGCVVCKHFDHHTCSKGVQGCVVSH